MEAREINTEYVPQNIFDLHIQNLRERAISEKELSDEKFDKFQAIIEKNLAEYKILIGDLKSELKADIASVKNELSETRNELKNEILEVRNEMTSELSNTNGRIDMLEEKIDHLTDSLVIMNDNVNQRIDDSKTKTGIYIAVGAVVVAVLQIAITVIFHYWG
ncbi:MAG: hypothetical protein IJQ57_00200 [Synergistaceae bacterium]|nr:hypothetical protein [Synergistaceae bacterium]MBR0234102.1 hypothetical protein [Synergistaceae bacterium]MBR0251748.1 hypothetical protein [Synergistaceae bacterium]